MKDWRNSLMNYKKEFQNKNIAQLSHKGCITLTLENNNLFVRRVLAGCSSGALTPEVKLKPTQIR